MIQKNSEIKIPEENIFEYDVLNRQGIIEDLSQLIISYNDPFVFSINADWGAGKTTFVNLWKAYLNEKHKVNSIYFSAWEDDFSKNPLISILGELNQYFKMKFEDEKKLENFKSAGVSVVESLLSIGVKYATNGLIEADGNPKKLYEEISKNRIEKLIDTYSKDKEITTTFKEYTEKILNELDSEKPLVIFIDELDRCRPIYAIELLERIKHIFGIPKLIFALSIDKIQLSESIKSQYGNIDTDNYLRRFIDLEYNLKNPNVENFCEALYEKFKFREMIMSKNQNDCEYIIDVIKGLSSVLKFNLRQIEQIFTKLNIIFKTISKGYSGTYFIAVIFFEMLKSHNQELYIGLIDRGLSREEIKTEVLKEFKISSRYNRWIKLSIRILIESVSKTEEELEKIIRKNNQEIESLKENQANTRKVTELRDQNEILSSRGFNNKRNSGINILIEDALKKIEFADRFNFEEK